MNWIKKLMNWIRPIRYVPISAFKKGAMPLFFLNSGGIKQ